MLMMASADDRETLAFQKILIMMRIRGSGIRMDN